MNYRGFFKDHLKQFINEPHPHLSEASGVIVPRLRYGRANGEFDPSIADSEMIYGASDGIIMLFTVVAGIVGAALNSVIVPVSSVETTSRAALPNAIREGVQ